MKTQTRLFLPASLILAVLVMPMTALAAPAVDPHVVGHWRGAFPGPTKHNPTVDLILKPGGIETMTVNVPRHPFVFHAVYSTAPGVLTMTRTDMTPAEATGGGHKTQKLKYVATPTTLLLDDGTPSGRVLFHRVKD